MFKKVPEYRVWSGMKNRCSANPSSDRNYAGRGITVCERWASSFENFMVDMGRRPSSRHSIDRIDVNGNYEPTNCRWATPSQQARNRRDTVWITIDGITHSISDWSDLSGVHPGTIESRIESGMEVRSAVFTPAEKRGASGLRKMNEERKRVKYSVDQVRKVRAAYAEGRVSLNGLSRATGIPKTTLHQIITNKTWRHV